MESFNKISPQSLNELLTSATCQVIDVREAFEHESEKIEPSILLPLSKLEQMTNQIDNTQPVFLVCRSGARATKAAEKLSQMGFRDLFILAGGLMAWSEAGLPIKKGESKVWAMDRQVRMTAGLLVLVGILLTSWVHGSWIWLVGFVGAGLTFSALTNTCTMALFLNKMPWNNKARS